MNIAILSISDTRSPDNDVSGQKLAELAGELGNVVSREIVTDDTAAISAALMRICDGGNTDCVLTTGGTGFADRDNTPEATHAVIEREAPGIAEAMRRETARFTPYAMLSRAVSGIRGRTIIVNFPGSTKAVEECFEVIRPVLSHAISLLRANEPH